MIEVDVYDGSELTPYGDETAATVLGTLLRAAGCEIRFDAGSSHTTYVSPAGNHITVRTERERR